MLLALHSFHDQVSERALLTQALYLAYARVPENRRGLRPLLAGLLARASALGDAARGVAPAVAAVLRVVGAVAGGLARTPANERLLFDAVLPLFRVPGKTSHMTPSLSLFHEPLMFVVASFLRLARGEGMGGGEGKHAGGGGGGTTTSSRRPSLVVPVVKAILDAWPSSWAGNSPKEVLLLHSLETILEFATPDTFFFGGNDGESDGDSDGDSDAAMADGGEGKAGEGKSSAGAAPSRLGLSTVRSALIARLGASVASDNSTVAERALKPVTKNFLSFGVII